MLWFAWKFVPLWYQQQLNHLQRYSEKRCDLLENSYLCGISNNWAESNSFWPSSCDLLENSYLCGISNNVYCLILSVMLLWFAWKFVPLWYQQQHLNAALTSAGVVICLKIRTFVVSATTHYTIIYTGYLLWFAWKFVPLWYQQQPSELSL